MAGTIDPDQCVALSSLIVVTTSTSIWPPLLQALALIALASDSSRSTARALSAAASVRTRNQTECLGCHAFSSKCDSQFDVGLCFEEEGPPAFGGASSPPLRLEEMLGQSN